MVLREWQCSLCSDVAFRGLFYLQNKAKMAQPFPSDNIQTAKTYNFITAIDFWESFAVFCCFEKNTYLCRNKQGKNYEYHHINIRQS